MYTVTLTVRVSEDSTWPTVHVESGKNFHGSEAFPSSLAETRETEAVLTAVREFGESLVRGDLPEPPNWKAA